MIQRDCQRLEKSLKILQSLKDIFAEFREIYRSFEILDYFHFRAVLGDFKGYFDQRRILPRNLGNYLKIRLGKTKRINRIK